MYKCLSPVGYQVFWANSQKCFTRSHGRLSKFAFYCCDKTLTKSSLKRGLFGLQIPISWPLRELGQQFKQEGGRNHEGMLLIGLISGLCSATSTDQLCRSSNSHSRPCPTFHINKKWGKCHTDVPEINLIREIPLLRFALLRGRYFVKLRKINQYN